MWCGKSIYEVERLHKQLAKSLETHRLLTINFLPFYFICFLLIPALALRVKKISYSLLSYQLSFLGSSVVFIIHHKMKQVQCITHSFVSLLELLSILSFQSDFIMRLSFPSKFSRSKLKVNNFPEFCWFVRNGLRQHFTPYCSNSGSEYETYIWGSGNSKRVCTRVDVNYLWQEET